MDSEKMSMYLCLGLIGIPCVLIIIYAIYGFLKRGKEEKKRRETQEQYNKVHSILFKSEDEKLRALLKLKFDDIPRSNNIKKLVDFEMSSKKNLLIVEDRINDDVEERAKADVFFSCLVSARMHLIIIYERLLKADIEYFIDERERNKMNTLVFDAGREICVQFSSTNDAVQIANAFNTIMAGLKKYHDVMMAILKKVPLENNTIEEHILLIEANAIEIKDALSSEAMVKLDVECPGGKTYGVLKMIGESIEKKMVKYFEFMDVIYAEIKE